MNVGKSLCNIYFVSSLQYMVESWERVTQVIFHSKFTLHKRGWFLILRIANYILCNDYLVAFLATSLGG